MLLYINTWTFVSGTSEQDPIRDSPSPQAESILPTVVPMIPKIEPEEEYTESNYNDYSDIGENFMSHFMEEPAAGKNTFLALESYKEMCPSHIARVVVKRRFKL